MTKDRFKQQYAGSIVVVFQNAHGQSNLPEPEATAMAAGSPKNHRTILISTTACTWLDVSTDWLALVSLSTWTNSKKIAEKGMS